MSGLVSVAVMHHPSRPERLARLLGDLDREVQVAVDPAPNGPRGPWRTARVAWAMAGDAPWHLVVQDDALVCDGFLDAVEAALSHADTQPVCFFVGLVHPGGEEVRRRAGRYGWARLPEASWYPTVATALPAPLAEALSRFPRPMPSDDCTFGRFCNERALRPWATAPSLVQHDDDAVSVNGSRHRRRRWAACFIGDCDWRDIDWTLRP